MSLKPELTADWQQINVLIYIIEFLTITLIFYKFPCVFYNHYIGMIVKNNKLNFEKLIKLVSVQIFVFKLQKMLLICLKNDII